MAGSIEQDLAPERRPAVAAPPPHPGDPAPAPADGDLRFPDGFLWGCQTAPTQVEGGGIDNSFIRWFSADPKKRVDDGTIPLPGLDHWNRLEADYADLAANGHNAHAFAIDWARIEPVDGGPFDQAAMDHYKREIDICRARGMEPIITLLHYALPQWLAAKGGVLADEAPARFERFGRYVTEQVGDRVTWWNTMNEPNALAGMGYMEGIWPPGESNIIHFLQAMGACLRMHAAGARAIRSVQAEHGRNSMISVANNVRPMHPKQAWNPLDWAAAKLPDYLVNRWFVRSVAKGRPAFGLGGKVLGLFDFKTIDGLKGSFDWIGLNYYTRDFIHVTLPFLSHAKDATLQAGGFIEMTPIQNKAGDTYPTDTTYDPDGMYETAAWLWGQFHKPIMITENGIPDLTHRAPDGTLVDELRPRYLVDTAAVMHHLIADGIPVAGYMHWTDWDNWEWAAGFRPKFGLFSFDHTTGQREPKFGATVFKTLATQNAVPEGWLTDLNRQSPLERDRFSREEAEDAGVALPERAGDRSLRPVALIGRKLAGWRARGAAETAAPAGRDVGL